MLQCSVLTNNIVLFKEHIFAHSCQLLFQQWNSVYLSTKLKWIKICETNNYWRTDCPLQCISWTRAGKYNYSNHNCSPPVPILSQLGPVHTLTSHSWRSKLILSSHLRLGLPSGLFRWGFPTRTLYTPLLHPIRATCPTHLTILDFITRKKLGE